MTRDDYSWHRWWAWYPVSTPVGIRWLCAVARKRMDNGIKGSQNHDSWWVYSTDTRGLS